MKQEDFTTKAPGSRDTKTPRRLLFGKLLRDVPWCKPLPRGYRVAYARPLRAVSVAAPIGLHLIIRLVALVVLKVRMAARGRFGHLSLHERVLLRLGASEGRARHLKVELANFRTLYFQAASESAAYRLRLERLRRQIGLMHEKDN